MSPDNSLLYGNAKLHWGTNVAMHHIAIPQASNTMSGRILAFIVYFLSVKIKIK